MIVADAGPELALLAARLGAKAKALAEAKAERRLLERRSDPARWRKAGLLWPLFTKG